MKKHFCLFLALLMAIAALSGCDFQMTMLPQNTITNTVPTTTEGTQPTEESMAPTGGDPAEITLPEESFEMVNGVYATCENYDFTFYMNLNANMQPKIEFYLVTEKPLPEDASVTIPGISADYWTAIHDRSPNSADVFFKGCNKVLYAHLSDPDFDFTAHLEEGRRLSAEYDRLYTLIWGEDGRQPGEAFPENHPSAESYLNAQTEWQSYCERYEAAYQEYLASQTMPDFHIYIVQCFFTSVPAEEQIEAVELAAGEMSRRIPMANVWIAPKPTGLNTKGIAINATILDPNTQSPLGGDSFTSVNSAGTYPFGTGLSTYTYYFTASKDITLENLMPYGDNDRIRVEWAELAILSNRGTVVTAKWFPGAEMLIRKGEQVAIKIYHSDPYTELFSYGSANSFVIEYVCDAEQCQIVCGSAGFRDISQVSYEAYLQIVQGIDLSRYFREYFSANETFG